jgi:hypothetical protein
VILLALLALPLLSSETKKPAMACCAMMQQDNAKLQALVDDMNKADAATKVDKMAAVINELIAQRSAMQKRMAAMHDGKEGMAGCAMMEQAEKH